jgi:protein-S-isoprenylcysteine O-methyltransferase Ste14
MKILDTIRYGVAIVVLASFPPSLLLWVVIHPFSAFWRSLGVMRTYILLGIPVIGYVIAIWVLRDSLIGIDLGSNPITIIPAAAVLLAAFLLSRWRTRQLNFSTLSGVPELTPNRYPGTLLTEGVYGLIRHPRYIEAYLWATGYALFADYLGSYLVLILCLPIMYWVVVLEERELRGRFGEEYAEYCRRVPRFIPRLNLRKVGDRSGPG